MTDSSKKSLIEALRERAFCDIPDASKELAELSVFFGRRKFSRNTTLLSIGEKWDTVFFIDQGIIRLFYTDSEGREFNKGFFWEDQFVWPVAPSARKQDSLFSIAALEDVTVWNCRFSLFYSWLKQHGHWEKFALPYAESFAELKFLREYEFLLNSARERYRAFCIQYPALVRRIPDYHVASYLGITNVTLSRIKNSR